MPNSHRHFNKQKYGANSVAFMLFGIVILLFVHSLIIKQSHDWDLDTFLYLGSGLDHGELIYLRDFESKLPLLQYIFWLPHRFGGIGAWRLITFVVSLLLVVTSTHFIVTTLTDDRSNFKKISRNIVLLSSSVSLLFLYSLPGSESAQITMFAAVFIYQAIALWHRALKSAHKNFYIALSGAAAAIAVSIRPNYGFTLPAFAMFSSVVTIASADTHKYIHAIKQVGLFIATLSLVTIVQFAPYFFYTRGPSGLLAGLLALRQVTIESSFKDFLKAQFFDHELVAFYLLMYALMGVMFIELRRKEHKDLSHLISLSGFLACIVSIVGLNVSIIATHYGGDHYTIMFLPYVAVIGTYLCISFFQRQSVIVQAGLASFNTEGFVLSILLVGWCFSVSELPKKAYQLAFKIEKDGLAINNRNVDPSLTELLKRAIDRGISFYVPGNVNYHRLLNHERIGDGHPYILKLILKGRRVGPINDIFLYSETVYNSPCTALWESRKDLIVIGEFLEALRLEVLRCLTAPGTNYEELLIDSRELTQSLEENLENYRIFVYREKFEDILSRMNQM